MIKNCMKRYHRQVIVDKIGENGQQKIMDSNILIIGFGGLGTGVAMNLVRMGVGHLGIVENDIVDISNLQRQILFDENDIDNSKIDCGIEKLRKINSSVIIDKYYERLNESNASDIIKNYDIIVDCTDNYETRYIINKACIDNNKKCVFGAVNEFEGSVMSYIPGNICYECVMGNYDSLKENKEKKVEVGVLGAMVSLVSSIQALEVIKLILNFEDNLAGKLLIIDGLDYSFTSINLSVKDSCYCNVGVKNENIY